MNKALISLLILIVVVIGAVVSCPDKAAHQAALMDELNIAMQDKLLEKTGDSNVAKGVSLLGGSFVSMLFDNVLGTTLKTNNYFVFSTAEIAVAGRSRVVSVGAFGHVFTLFDADDVKEQMKNL